jgi:hypothetical protein
MAARPSSLHAPRLSCATGGEEGPRRDEDAGAGAAEDEAAAAGFHWMIGLHPVGTTEESRADARTCRCVGAVQLGLQATRNLADKR